MWKKCILRTGKHKLNTVLATPFLNRLNYVDIATSYRLIIIIKVYVYFKSTS